MAAPPITERHKHHFHRLAPIKEVVRCATTANITISTGLNNGDTIDGITLVTGDRVLVKDQSTGSQNGIYVVGVTPVRDYDVSTDDPGYGWIVLVLQGTTNAGTLWQNTNTATPTIGSTALTFAAVGGTNLSGIDFLVGTATGLLSAEIVVGTAPGGELGNTWASPTVDSTHSGSAHSDFIAKSLLTTQDDIIVRDGTGPARLAKGSDGQVLTVDPTTHHLVWATSSSGFANPMTTKGDLIVGDTGGSPIRKGIGTDGWLLTADAASAGGMKWAAGTGGGSVATDPIWDAKGDLAGGTGADAAARLAVGSNGQVLTADSGETTGMKWATPTGGGGLAASILGYDTVGGSAVAATHGMGYFKKVTFSADTIVLSVGVNMAMTTLAGTAGMVGLYADSGGSPAGAPLTVGVLGVPAGQPGIVGTTPTTYTWWEFGLSGKYAAGDYWFGIMLDYQASSWNLHYDGSGTDKEVTFSDAGFLEGITYRASVASASRKYSLRLLVLA